MIANLDNIFVSINLHQLANAHAKRPTKKDDVP